MAVHTADMATAAQVPRTARSAFPAPIFCPTKAVTALQRLCTGKKAIESSLLPTLKPAP